jgi:hypothetical protein
MTNPFDAVIADLRWIISIHKTADFASIEDIERVIRLLEVAGKVDKEVVMTVLGDVRTLLAREGRTAFIWAIKDALQLLSALPDPVTKKEK